MGWRDDVGDLPNEQRQLIEGGELSQRFAKLHLGITHPALIGGFYGFLVAISLLLPICYANGWNQETLRDWAFLGLLLMLILAIIAHVSLFFATILRRPPVSLRRAWVFPMPFLGLSIISVFFVTDVESELSEIMANGFVYLGWILLLGPGPAYIHLSWAPRWRILCRLEEGLDPFEGYLPEPENDDDMESSDKDMEVVIDSIEENPPVLYQSDSEE
mgnify:CR=1 FL=1|tara:strand:- start:96 stop:746 length:651 start_codon:yes stop_codon:yes gene_type:complete